ncbi:histone deacetylase HDT4 [Capsella rubella]|uniref:histone deacetylase HDT4 n=1 Tax=Capsella rubella TaxID=81985 RepID=UPI000CD5BAB3|nr:histone deacetylase HDT4 [Capsella rubella]
MEFWGIEVKPGKPLMAEPEDGYMIHVSQVSIDLSKVNEDENVLVYVKYGDDKNKYLIGNLSHKFPQVSLDLFFDQEFEISHDSKTSVFLLGNQTPDDEQDEEIDSDSELDEFMGQQIGALPPNGMNNEIEPIEDVDSSEEDSDSDSDEMISSDDEDESDEEDVEDEAALKVEPSSEKIPNGKAMNNNTVASKKAKAAFQNKSSGGKKKCPFPCGSSCKN